MDNYRPVVQGFRLNTVLDKPEVKSAPSSPLTLPAAVSMNENRGRQSVRSTRSKAGSTISNVCSLRRGSTSLFGFFLSNESTSGNVRWSSTARHSQTSSKLHHAIACRSRLANKSFSHHRKPPELRHSGMSFARILQFNIPDCVVGPPHVDWHPEILDPFTRNVSAMSIFGELLQV